MAPSNLQGLNIVHTSPPQNPFLSDQDLLSVPFPDLSAQLDLWTNLNFQSDEPLVSRKDTASEKRRESVASSEDDAERYNIPDEDLQNTGKMAEAHSHENVVTGTVVPPAPVQNTSVAVPAPEIPAFDFGSILAGIGVDPFQIPSLPQLGAASVTPSLAQLLSLHTAATLRSMSTPAPVPAPAPQPAPVQAPQPAAPTTNYPALKRSRTSTRASTAEAQSPSEPTSPVSPEADDKPNTTPVTAAEDKRRRNTAASARFRLKKKEREAALERKAKELETRVAELEKECEALRRENGWLKGLVVGVTGAGAVQQQQAAAGAKRGRDEDTNVA